MSFRKSSVHLIKHGSVKISGQWLFDTTDLYNSLVIINTCYRPNKSIGDDTKAAARWSLNCILKKIKIWRKTICIMADGILTPCNMARSRHWFRQVTAPCNVALESWQWIHQMAAPCNMIRGTGMTCHWIRPNVCHIGILHLVSISTHHRSRHVILY